MNSYFDFVKVKYYIVFVDRAQKRMKLNRVIIFYDLRR